MPGMVNFKLTATGQFWMPDEASDGGGGGEQTGILTASDWVTTSLDFQVGWKFNVGINDLEVSHLRFYNPDEAEETVRIWDEQSEELVASAAVTGAASGYGETEITPVTLTSGKPYIVTHHADDVSRAAYRNPAFSVNSELAALGSRYISGGGFPGGATGNDYVAADIRFGLGSGASPASRAVASFSGAGGAYTSAFRLGWVFTVGASDLEVVSFRTYLPSVSGDSIYRVMIHRNSDNSVMAQADIGKNADAWAEASITPVTLAAGVQYTVSGDVVKGNRGVYSNTTGLSYASEITVDNDGVYGTSGDSRPTISAGSLYVLMADFGFNVP